MNSWRFVARVAVIVWLGACRANTPPATLGEVPPFHMTAVTGERSFPLSSIDLRGKPYIADFIFTHCAGPCPVMSARMANLQSRLPDNVRMISFSIDPLRDTPEVLKEYARRFRADPNRWWFLRGTPETVKALAVNGFHLGVEENPEAPSGLRFLHSTKFVLVDSSGTLRGYYDSQDDALYSKLRRDLQRL